MSKKKSKTKATKENKVQNAEQSNEQQAPIFKGLGQLLKDVSFECPVPAYELGDAQQTMDLNISVNVARREAPENTWDVTLAMRGEAKIEEKTVFLVELAYGGIFLVKNLEEDKVSALLHVDAVSMLYPFARSVFMQLITEGGYRPPMLDPVNFFALYQQRKQQVEAEKNKK